MAQQPCSDGLQRGPHCGPAVDAGDPHGGQYLRMQQRLARQLSRAFGSGRLSGGAAAALRELCPSARFFRCARRRLFGCFFKPVAPESRARAVQRGSGRAERRARLGAEHGQHAGRRAAPRRAAAARRRRGLLAAAEPLAAHRARRPAPARPCTPGRSLIAGRRAAALALGNAALPGCCGLLRLRCRVPAVRMPAFAGTEQYIAQSLLGRCLLCAPLPEVASAYCCSTKLITQARLRPLLRLGCTRHGESPWAAWHSLASAHPLSPRLNARLVCQHPAQPLVAHRTDAFRSAPVSSCHLRCTRPSRYGDLEDAFAVGAESVVFAPVPGPGLPGPGVKGGACAVLTLGTDGDAVVDAPCGPTAWRRVPCLTARAVTCACCPAALAAGQRCGQCRRCLCCPANRSSRWLRLLCASVITCGSALTHCASCRLQENVVGRSAGAVRGQGCPVWRVTVQPTDAAAAAGCSRACCCWRSSWRRTWRASRTGCSAASRRASRCAATRR